MLCFHEIFFQECLIGSDGVMDSRHFNVFFATYRAFSNCPMVLDLLLNRFEAFDNESSASGSAEGIAGQKYFLFHYSCSLLQFFLYERMLTYAYIRAHQSICLFGGADRSLSLGVPTGLSIWAR